MKVRSLTLFICLLVSQVGMSQVATEEEVSFWDKQIAGMYMSELVISISAVIFVVFIAYRLSISAKRK